MGADKIEGEKRARWTEGIRLVWGANGTQAALSGRASLATARWHLSFRAAAKAALSYGLRSSASEPFADYGSKLKRLSSDLRSAVVTSAPLLLEAPSRLFDHWSAIDFMPAIRVAPGAKHIVGSNPTLSASTY
jgi:hypothetical protein